MTQMPYLPDQAAGHTQSIPLLSGSVHHETHTNAFVMLHRLLRGRYLLAGVLGVLGAAGGAVAGYMTQTPQYRCEGQVQVMTNLGVILHDTPETRNLPNPDRVVNTQGAFIASDRVIAAAMNSEEWRAIGRVRDPQAEREFRDSLRVIANRDAAELISVSFTDRDAKASRAGVDAVLRAYESIHVKDSDDDQKTRVLEEERHLLDKEINDLQSRIETLARPYGNDDLTRLHEVYTNHQMELEASVFKLKQLAAGFETQPGATPAGDPAVPIAKAALTPEDIAGVDPTMRDLLKDKSDLEGRLLELAENGLREEHRAVKQTKNQLAAVEKKIAAYAEKFATGKVIPPSNVELQARSMTPDQVRALLTNTEAQYEDWHKKTNDLYTTKTKLDDMRAKVAEKRSDMRAVIDRLSDLRRQSGARGEGQQRIRIYWPVDTPALPTIDKRVRMGLLGLVGGGGLPVAIIAMWGLWVHRSRFTYSDQARERGARATLLGILPQLPRDLSDPEQSAAAAHCVHQMRTLLQIGDEERKVFAITSSTAGDGKTSLALSLGMSFAASGARTLLVDFDMIGHGLTSALKCRTDHGLVAVLEAGSLNGSVISTPFNGLSLLPTGRDDERFVSRLSRTMVRDLIEKARAQFDVVIIDTGPILGSLEANYVSSEADGVVLVVGRGQHRAYVDRAFEHLHALGARVAGMVFNKASSTDFMQSATSTSFRSVREEPLKPVDLKDVPDYEPVARTVALDIRR